MKIREIVQDAGNRTMDIMMASGQTLRGKVHYDGQLEAVLLRVDQHPYVIHINPDCIEILTLSQEPNEE